MLEWGSWCPELHSGCFPISLKLQRTFMHETAKILIRVLHNTSLMYFDRPKFAKSVLRSLRRKIRLIKERKIKLIRKIANDFDIFIAGGRTRQDFTICSRREALSEHRSPLLHLPLHSWHVEQCKHVEDNELRLIE